MHHCRLKYLIHMPYLASALHASAIYNFKQLVDLMINSWTRWRRPCSCLARSWLPLTTPAPPIIKPFGTAAAPKLHLLPICTCLCPPLPHLVPSHPSKLPLWVQLLNRTSEVTPGARILLCSIKAFCMLRPTCFAPMEMSIATGRGPEDGHDTLEGSVGPLGCIAEVVFQVDVHDRGAIAGGKVVGLSCRTEGTE